MPAEKEEKQYIEIWEDLVHIKDLVWSIMITSFTTMGAYLLAPEDATKSLIFGLLGTVIGFVISSIIIKPKRTFEYLDEEE